MNSLKNNNKKGKISRSKYDFEVLEDMNSLKQIPEKYMIRDERKIIHFKKQTSVLKKGNDIYKFHLNNIDNLVGCFGGCSVIDHIFLTYLQNKYNILNLISCITKRKHRKTLERLLSCVFEKENIQSKINTRRSLLGDIFKSVNKQKLGHSVYIEKQFIGR